MTSPTAPFQAGTGRCLPPSAPEDKAVPSQWSALSDPGPFPHPAPAAPSSTDLTECGKDWDAVAIQPLSRGLAALDRLRLPLTGYPVLADRRSDQLYVLVHPGSARLCTAPGSRALSRGSWLLLPGPTAQAGCRAAQWLNRTTGPARLASAPQLRAALREVDRLTAERLQQEAHATQAAPQSAAAQPTQTAQQLVLAPS